MLNLLTIEVYIQQVSFHHLRLFMVLTHCHLWILTSLPLSECMNLDGEKKAEFVKMIHEKAQLNIKRRTKQYVHQANKGRKQVVFELGDWVWLHLRKDRFLEKQRSKLLPQGDGPFQVVECINDNAYKLDLPGEYGVSACFNVANLSPFDVGDDLRANSS
jgi:hypothetical protein